MTPSANGPVEVDVEGGSIWDALSVFKKKKKRKKINFSPPFVAVGFWFVCLLSGVHKQLLFQRAPCPSFSVASSPRAVLSSHQTMLLLNAVLSLKSCTAL